MCGCVKGTCGVTVMAVGKEISKTEFNSWTMKFAFLYNANTLGKSINPSLLPLAMDKY